MVVVPRKPASFLFSSCSAVAIGLESLKAMASIQLGIHTCIFEVVHRRRAFGLRLTISRLRRKVLSVPIDQSNTCLCFQGNPLSLGDFENLHPFLAAQEESVHTLAEKKIKRYRAARFLYTLLTSQLEGLLTSTAAAILVF